MKLINMEKISYKYMYNAIKVLLEETYISYTHHSYIYT